MVKYDQRKLLYILGCDNNVGMCGILKISISCFSFSGNHKCMERPFRQELYANFNKLYNINNYSGYYGFTKVGNWNNND